MTPVARHRIWFSIQDGIQALDLAGPYEVFAAANGGIRRFELTETPFMCAPGIERIRVQSARQHLEHRAEDRLDVVARTNGFRTTETMRRAFVRRIGIPPDDYRRRFALAPIR